MEIRPYQSTDAASWLRCRVLAFLDTSYFDDVRTTKTAGECTVELVAVDKDEVIGLIDVEVDGPVATIDTIAVLPQHQRSGIATALLRRALDELSGRKIETLDAWTRDDQAANDWYARHGFHEQFRYLHVYATNDAEADRITAPSGLKTMAAFMHARIEDEERLRAEYARVHVCRQYLRAL